MSEILTTEQVAAASAHVKRLIFEASHAQVTERRFIAEETIQNTVDDLVATIAHLKDFIEWQFEDDDVDAAWADYEARDTVQRPVTHPMEETISDGTP